MSGIGHIPSWDHHGLPDGYAECIRCGQPITKEQLVSEPCPGQTTTPDECHREKKG